MHNDTKPQIIKVLKPQIFANYHELFTVFAAEQRGGMLFSQGRKEPKGLVAEQNLNGDVFASPLGVCGTPRLRLVKQPRPFSSL